MITIYTPKGEKLREIPNDDFFKHITTMELLAAHPEFDYTLDEDDKPWGFVASAEIILMYMGDHATIIYIPITRNVDVVHFKKHWYLEYCQVHGYSYTVTDYDSRGAKLKK